MTPTQPNTHPGEDPHVYVDGKTSTISTLMEALPRVQGQLGGVLEGDQPMDAEDRQLYEALLPELGLPDGMDITEQDILDALDAVAVGVRESHTYEVELSVNGPVAVYVKVHATGTPGEDGFTITGMELTYWWGGGEFHSSQVLERSPVWEFAEYVVHTRRDVYPV